MASNSEKNPNLVIWDNVWQTAPGNTRTSDFQGRIMTSINPTYLAKRATEQFGPIGIGWGYEIVEERIDNARPIFLNGEIQGHEMINTVRLKLWYMLDGKRGEVEHYGHTPYVYWSFTYKSFQVDMEASKKSLTDAMKKCLSLLGFSADVFLGLFEDPQYVEAAQIKEQIEKADDADEARKQEQQRFADWLEGELQLYGESKNKSALKIMHKTNHSKVHRQCQVLGLDFDKVWAKFEQAYKDAMTKDLPTVVCSECGVESKDKPGNICRDCGGKKVATSDSGQNSNK